MLSAKRLPTILQSALGSGLEGLVLISVEGGILSSAFQPSDQQQQQHDEVSLAAISAAIWSSYAQGGGDIYLHMEKLESGYLGIATIGKSYLIAGVGKGAPGYLKSRLLQLSQYFRKVFEQIK